MGLTLLLLSFSGFVALGLGDTALGVAWPSIAGVFDRQVSELGVVLAVGLVSYALCAAVTGAFIRRLGLGRALLVSAAAMAAGFSGFALAGSWPIILGAQALIGGGGALIDSGLNAYGALKFNERTMNLLHASFGLGAALGPVLLTAVIATGAGWRAGYAAVAVIQGLLLIAFGLARERWQVPPAADPLRRRRFALRGALAGVLVFAVYTGLEVAAGQWAFTLLTEDRGLGELAAGTWVTGYWVSLTIGRLAAAAVGSRLAAGRALRVGTIIALGGTVLFWWNPGPAIAALGLMAVGFGLAPVFPAMMLLTPKRVGSEHTTGAVGMQMAAAALGAAVLPGGIGVLVSVAGLGSVGPALFGGAVVLAAGAAVIHREQPAG